MSSDVADLFWFESTDVDLSAVARELAELAEDHVVRAYIHRRGFKAAAIYVSTEDPMAAPSLAQSCASALAKVAGCRTWYFAALGGTSSFLSVDALDAKGKVRWSAYSDEEMPPAKLRPLAKRLGLTVDEDIHGANFPYWKMVEDAGLPVAQHLS
ncbi:MAG: hypothetical protein HY901_12540, partial [Deltaproteobacteria bacterium]|nr:hypothetical protein [Deltaproteobacteria bacterium]